MEVVEVVVVEVVVAAVADGGWWWCKNGLYLVLENFYQFFLFF